MFPIKSVDRFDSFITFTDDFSRYGYIYPIKERSKALHKFKIFKFEVENQHDIKIKIVRFNRGGEYWIERLIKDDILHSLDFSNSDYCIDCIKGKYTNKVKKGEAKRSAVIL
jgi:hypothetical protein